jgi:hypothetical protein
MNEWSSYSVIRFKSTLLLFISYFYHVLFAQAPFSPFSAFFWANYFLSHFISLLGNLLQIFVWFKHPSKVVALGFIVYIINLTHSAYLQI